MLWLPWESRRKRSFAGIENLLCQICWFLHQIASSRIPIDGFGKAFWVQKKTKRLSKICILSFLKIQSLESWPTKWGGQRWYVVCTLQIVLPKVHPKPFANCFHIDSIRNATEAFFFTFSNNTTTASKLVYPLQLPFYLLASISLRHWVRLFLCTSFNRTAAEALLACRWSHVSRLSLFYCLTLFWLFAKREEG